MRSIGMTYRVIPAGNMARRLIAAVVVTACGATPTQVIEPGTPQLAVQTATEGGLRVIAFDAHDAMGAVLHMRDGMPSMTLALPGGDWLVGFDGHVAARVSHDGRIRWSREIAIEKAIAAGNDLVVATSFADTVMSIIGLHGDGSIAWRAEGGSITSQTRLVRTPGATIVVHANGELAVDDAGVVLWRIDRRGDHNSWALGAYVEGAGLVIVNAASASPETAFLPRPRMPMVAHLVDPRTGMERARAELAPDADAWALADIAVVGKRVVVHAADEIGTATPGGFVYKFVVFSVGRDSIAVADAVVAPKSVEELERVPRIARDEAIFLSGREITLVDPATHRVRSAPLIRVPSGSSVQIFGLHRVGDSFSFLGDLSGTLVIGDQRLHADVRMEQSMAGPMVFASLWFCGAFSPR